MMRDSSALGSYAIQSYTGRWYTHLIVRQVILPLLVLVERPSILLNKFVDAGRGRDTGGSDRADQFAACRKFSQNFMLTPHPRRLETSLHHYHPSRSTHVSEASILRIEFTCSHSVLSRSCLHRELSQSSRLVLLRWLPAAEDRAVMGRSDPDRTRIAIRALLPGVRPQPGAPVALTRRDRP
jgi:hypothetical protein